MLQVYAEAKAAYQAGEVAWFSRDEILILEQLNKRFMSISTCVEDVLNRVKTGSDEMTVNSIYAMMYQDEHARDLTQHMRSQILSALMGAGLKSKMRGSSRLFLVDAKKLAVAPPLANYGAGLEMIKEK
jgi:hypothetical protein